MRYRRNEIVLGVLCHPFLFHQLLDVLLHSIEAHRHRRKFIVSIYFHRMIQISFGNLTNFFRQPVDIADMSADHQVKTDRKRKDRYNHQKEEARLRTESVRSKHHTAISAVP